MNKNEKKPLLMPIILLLTVVPMIVHMHEYSSNLSQFDWYPASDNELDFFLYYKAVAIIIISAVMCCVLVYRYVKQKKEFRFHYQFIPLCVYAGMTVFSSLFSQYKYFCFHGVSEMFESVWVLLGYCVMAFYAYELVRTYDDIAYIMKWFSIAVAVMLVLGISQAVGHDFYGTRIGKMLISNSNYWNDLDTISLVFEKGRVFLSLYNPNYVASYFALVIPVLVALLVIHKQLKYKAAYVLMLIVSVICLLASGNRSGIIAFAVTAVLSIALFFRQIKKYWKIVLPSVGVFVVVFAVFIANNDYIIQKFARLLEVTEVTDDAISEIITGDDDVSITYKENVLKLSYQIDEEGTIALNVSDGDGQMVKTDVDASQGIYTLQDERFAGFTVQIVQMPDEEIGLDVFADNIHWYFEKGEDGTYYFYNASQKLDKINNAPRVAVKRLEKLFEERGTIWSKTIPMLKNSIIFGTGADTYALEYPQDDYVDKTYDGSTLAMDVKPHCFYLQVAVQSGMPALIAVVVFYLWYFISGLKLYRKASYREPLEIIGAGLLLSTFTYMVISFLNDSTVNVAPIFWVMLGLGIAVNHMLRERIAQTQQPVVAQDTADGPAVQAAAPKQSVTAEPPMHAANMPAQRKKKNRKKHR